MPTSRRLGAITGYGPVYPMAMKMSLTWKSSRMPACYTERQAAGRSAVARYYQVRGAQAFPNQPPTTLVDRDGTS